MGTLYTLVSSLSSAWKPCFGLDSLCSWPEPPYAPFPSTPPSSASAHVYPLPCCSLRLDQPWGSGHPSSLASQALKSGGHFDSSPEGRFRDVRGIGGSQEGNYGTQGLPGGLGTSKISSELPRNQCKEGNRCLVISLRTPCWGETGVSVLRAGISYRNKKWGCVLPNASPLMGIGL